MALIKFNVKGRKLEWGPKIAILRHNYGIVLLELNGKLEVVGGFIRYEDIKWCGDELIAVSIDKILRYFNGDFEAVSTSYMATTVTCLEDKIIIGTKEGDVLFFDKSWNLIKEIKVGDESVRELSITTSGFVLAKVGRFDLVIISPEGQVIAHHSYHWDLRNVRWSPDLETMIVFEEGKIKLLKYDKNERTYIKVDEVEGIGLDAKWCGEKVCILSEGNIYIYENGLESLKKPDKRLRVGKCNYCAWSRDCNDLALLGNRLYIITGISQSSS